MVDDVKVKTVLAAILRCALAPLEIVLPAGHLHQVRIGARKDAVKIRHLHIRFKRDTILESAVRRFRERLHPCPALLERAALAGFFVDSLFGAVVCRDAPVKSAAAVCQVVLPLCETFFLFGNCREINERRIGNKLFELLHLSLLCGAPFLGSDERFLGSFPRIFHLALTGKDLPLFLFDLRRIFVFQPRTKLVRGLTERRERALRVGSRLLRLGDRRR